MKIRSRRRPPRSSPLRLSEDCERKGDRWIGRFDVSGSAAKFELLLAAEQEQKSFPFQLSLR
ncbi:MAG: hypothetical protein ACWGNB_07700 [Thiogranum sp.]